MTGRRMIHTISIKIYTPLFAAISIFLKKSFTVYVPGKGLQRPNGGVSWAAQRNRFKCDDGQVLAIVLS